MPTAFLDPNLLPNLRLRQLHGAGLRRRLPRQCDENGALRAGDVVVLWFRPELITPGGLPGIIKRVGMMPPPWVTSSYRDHPQSEVLALIMLETNDQPDKLLRVRCRDLLAIHNDRGAFKGVARITDDVKAGIVVATLSNWRQLNHGTVNSILSGAFTDIGHAPSFSDNLTSELRSVPPSIFA